MRVQITTRRCDVTDALRHRAEELVEKLKKYDPRVSSADLVFVEEGRVKKIEAVLSVDRDDPVVAHGAGDEFAQALDVLIDRLAKILRRRRSQVRDHKARSLAQERAGD